MTRGISIKNFLVFLAIAVTATACPGSGAQGLINITDQSGAGSSSGNSTDSGDAVSSGGNTAVSATSDNFATEVTSQNVASESMDSETFEVEAQAGFVDSSSSNDNFETSNSGDEE